MSGLGLGGSASAGLPLGAATWAAWFDIRSLALADQSPIVSPVPSLVPGGLSLTPTWTTNPPKLVWYQQGGQQAALGNYADQSYFRSDALAALFSGLNTAVTIVSRQRATDPTHPTQPCWQAGSSGSSVNTFFRQSLVYAAQNIVTERNTVTTGTVSASTTDSVQFDDVVIVTRYDGQNVSVFVNGVLTSVSQVPLITTSLTVNRFAWLGWFSTGISTLFNGMGQVLAVAPFALTDAQCVTVSQNLLASSYVPVPRTPTNPQLIAMGDSLTQCDASNNGGGWLQPISDYWIANQQSWNYVGDREQGWYPNHRRSATGGFHLSQIQAEALSVIGTAGASNILLGTLVGGTNDLVSHDVPACVASYATCFNAVQSALLAQNTNSLLAVSPIPAIKNTNASSPYVDPYNAGIVPIWDAWDIAHPLNKVRRFNMKAAMGDVWNSTLYFDDTHPNTAGANAIAANLISIVGDIFQALSPTRLAA